MKTFILGFIIGAVISTLFSRLKETEKSHDGSFPDEKFLHNIGEKMNRSERYKEHRLPYKDLPLVNNIKDRHKKEKEFK